MAVEEESGCEVVKREWQHWNQAAFIDSEAVSAQVGMRLSLIAGPHIMEETPAKKHQALPQPMFPSS